MVAAAFLIATLACTLASQIAQKKLSERFVLVGVDNTLAFYLRERLFWFALAMLAVALVCWIVVIDIWPIGIAYPLLSINYVLMQFASRTLFSEEISPRRWVGVLTITSGVALVAGGGFS